MQKKTKKQKEINIITKDTSLGEVVRKYPETINIMFDYGLHCVGCHVALYETIEQGAISHGMTKKELDEMLREMNNAIKNKIRE
ncbi:MAG: DUF1858 domain-containing protein [Candidatus Aenigmatarchaeota archaeon]